MIDLANELKRLEFETWHYIVLGVSMLVQFVVIVAGVWALMTALQYLIYTHPEILPTPACWIVQGDIVIDRCIVPVP